MRDSKLGKAQMRDPDSKPYYDAGEPISSSSGQAKLDQGIVDFGPMRDADRAGKNAFFFGNDPRTSNSQEDN